MRIKPVIKPYAFLLAFGLLALGFSQNRQAAGRVYGTVADPYDAILIGASVMLKSLGNQVILRGTTNDDGAFVFADLVPGEYELTAESLGFCKFIKRLSVGEKGTEVNVNMKIHQCDDSVLRLTELKKTTEVFCELHREKMLVDIVPITYGLIVTAVDAKSEGFPHSNFDYHGGCVVDCYEKAEVLYCPDCRKAELQWNKEHLIPQR